MIENKQKLYGILLSIIAICSIVLPYLIFDASILPNYPNNPSSFPKGQEEELGIFPEYLYENITSVQFIYGDPIDVNDLNELKFNDNDTYDIKSELNGLYRLDVRFKFPVDASKISYGYDCYVDLNLSTDLDIGILYFQAESEGSWITILEITNESIILNRTLIDECTEFRFYGDTINEREIFIEKLRYIPQNTPLLSQPSILKWSGGDINITDNVFLGWNGIETTLSHGSYDFYRIDHIKQNGTHWLTLDPDNQLLHVFDIDWNYERTIDATIYDDYIKGIGWNGSKWHLYDNVAMDVHVLSPNLTATGFSYNMHSYIGGYPIDMFWDNDTRHWIITKREQEYVYILSANFSFHHENHDVSQVSQPINSVVKYNDHYYAHSNGDVIEIYDLGWNYKGLRYASKKCDYNGDYNSMDVYDDKIFFSIRVSTNLNISQLAFVDVPIYVECVDAWRVPSEPFSYQDFIFQCSVRWKRGHWDGDWANYDSANVNSTQVLFRNATWTSGWFNTSRSSITYPIIRGDDYMQCNYQMSPSIGTLQLQKGDYEVWINSTNQYQLHSYYREVMYFCGFPELNYVNPQSINLKLGTVESGTFSSLEERDSDFYTIKTQWNSTELKYMFNIDFDFGYPADLSSYYIGSYDYWLQFRSEITVNADPVYLQRNTTSGWVNITEITNLAVTINNILIENATEIRIFGKSNQHKTLEIDLFKILPRYDRVTPSGVGTEEFTNLTTSLFPSSPISITETFQIRSDAVHPLSYTIVWVGHWIEGYSVKWLPMTQHGSGYYYDELQTLDLDVGNHTAWVMAYDNTGRYTFEILKFRIENNRPTITFINPIDSEKVTEFYGLNINISITEPESEDYSDVAFTLFNDTTTIVEWTLMERYNLLNPSYWNYTIDPIDIFNDIYTLRARAKDERGFGYNSIQIEILNYRPNITFVSPQEFEVIITENYTIIIEIEETEGDIYSDVEVLIYQTDIDNPVLSWTQMLRIGSSDYWKHDFNFAIIFNGIYYIRVRAKDLKGFGFSEILITTSFNAPIIEIKSPLSAVLTGLSYALQTNITSTITLQTIKYTITSSLTETSIWHNMTYISNYTQFSFLYQASFSLLNFEYGDYYLIVNASNGANYSSAIRTYAFHPSVIYQFINITYNSENIIVSYTDADTSEILGYVEIDHNTIAKERNFEVYIPSKFDDAYNYYIYRGFSQIDPIGFFDEGSHTIWQVSAYESDDTVYFNLEKPDLDNAPIVTVTEAEDIEMPFTIETRHPFTNVTVRNKLISFLFNPEVYDYKLYYLFEGEYNEIEDFTLTLERGNVRFEFQWVYLSENGTVSFLFKGWKLPEIEDYFITYSLYGVMFLAIVNVPFHIIFTVALKNFKRNKWGTRRWLLYSIILGVGSFIGGMVYGWTTIDISAIIFAK